MATLAGKPEEIIVDGEEYWQLKALLRVKKHWRPEDGVMVAFAPPGGVANFPALAQGAPGLPITIRQTHLTELAADDPTEASARWELITPGSAEVAPVYDFHVELHQGEAGDDGTLTILTATDWDSTGAQAGYVLALKSNGAGGYNGIEAVSLRVGNTYWPTAMTVLSNAAGSNALCPVVIPSAPFKRRFHCEGQWEVRPDGPDVQVDVVARLTATDGVVIARGLGLAGGSPQIVNLAASPPVGSSPGFGEVAAGVGPTTVFFRAEQIGSGSDTYDTVSGRSLCSVTVQAVS